MIPGVSSLARVRRHSDPRVPVYVRRETHRRALAALMAQHLPALQAKVRRRMLDELATRVMERAGEIELFFELDPQCRLAATILHLRQVIPRLEDEHAELARRFEELVMRHDALAAAEDRIDLLEEHLREASSSPSRLRADRAALRRHLDLEALKERNDGERHHLLVLAELGLELVAGGARTLADGGSPEHERARAMLEGSDLVGFAQACVQRSSRWQTRRVGMLGLAALLDVGVSRASLDVARLRARIDDEREHPWVVAASLDVLWRVDAEAARTIGTRRLREPRPQALDFLVRRLVLDRIHRDPEHAMELLADPDVLSDPAEHVRQGLVLAARRLLPLQPAALHPLESLAGTESAGDPSPRVRALAGEALARTLGEPPAEHTDRAMQSLHRWLERERHELALVVALDELRASIDRLVEAEEEARLARLVELAPSLVELSASDDVSATVHEGAAATLETLDRATDPQRRALVQRLRAVLAPLPAPARATVHLDDAASPSQVGRALAELSRDDFGLDASVSNRRLRIRRGDRFTTRLWRILHELRHPAPNKRQGFRHTIGRMLRGHLRAPSGRLHEVTATVVPGERVHIASEGGWARHVPTVDDATSLPLLATRDVEIFSSFGTTRLRATGSLPRRLWSRLRLITRYAELAALRTTSLSAREPEQRRQYLETLRDRYGIEVRLEPPPVGSGPPRRLPERVTSLVPTRERSAAVAVGPGALAPDLVTRIDEWLDSHLHYFMSMQANDQASLAAFFVGAFALFLGDSFRRRRSIDRARAAIPLCIGGWGTRGKSGTERIKAGLFHGLGYQVFSKTTGCEAMMIHSIPEGPSSEIFVFRPYGKATIWEQRTLLELGAALRADVFLWECMALNPKYVEILQHEWMRDDLSTLTNAYPDHEDIQGPAGADVADTISRFIPRRGTLVTSEINFLPLFREVCRRRECRLEAVPEREGDLVAPELLDLFPYQEHPRNIALVARMAEQLGIDRDLAIVTMAQHVVPDLGVLKRYPPVRVHGRVLEFINGCSANERAGFLANWERTGCAALADSEDPEQLVITVVNNRDDRISRSEVFARILVGDTIVDRHVLIGTNLRGLLAYLRASLSLFLADQTLVRPADLQDSEGPTRATARLATLMRRLRIPSPRADVLLAHVDVYARGCGLELREVENLREAFERMLANDGSVDLSAVRRELEDDEGLRSALARSLVATEPPAEPPTEPPADTSSERVPEVLGPCTRAELETHTVRQLARSVIHARLHRALETACSSGREVDACEERVREAFRELFDDMLVVVEDPKTKGDAIIQTCARCVPPGTHVRIMGTQNIKGTGLDFVYRWLAVDAVVNELSTLDQGDDDERLGALERLRAFGDHGVVDLGLVHHTLERTEPRSPEERVAMERLQAKVEPDYRRRRSKLETSSEGPTGGSARKGWIEAAAGWVEGWLDFLDGARRYHASARIMKDLVHGRISHPKAAILMREIYAREKGGWLLAGLRRS